MARTSQRIAWLGLVAALLIGAPRIAAAEMVFSAPAGTGTSFWLFQWSGTPIMIVQAFAPGPPCTIHSLGVQLNDDIRIEGSSTGDQVIIAQVPQTLSLCGLTGFQPFEQNGHHITVHGNGGPDLLLGGTGAITVDSGTNNDTVFGTSYFAGGLLIGNTGHDSLKGTSKSGDRLIGGGGDDLLCEASWAVIAEMKGNSGTNYRCGNATNKDASLTLNCSLACP